MSNKLLATLLLVLTFVGLATAGIISRPTKTTGGTSYTDGTIPHDSDLNGDADTIYTLVNGNIEDANIKAGAAISASKITPNFAANIQVTTAAAPCFVNINSVLGADLKQWRICQNGSGVLSIATYTDAGAVIITPLSIARATGIITTSGGLVVGNGLTVSAGGIAVTGGIQTSDLTAKSFLYSGTAGLFTTTAAPTNGQMLIGSTGNNPVVGTITGTATHICTTLGAGTFALDFCSNPALASPAITGTVTGSATYNTPTLSAPTNTGTTTIQGLVDASNAGAGQFQFPATQNPSANANTLDDYAEGSWTPSVGGSATYSAQVGRYIKIGRLVTATCLMNINAIGTGSLDTISGLPFTSINTSNVSYTAPINFVGLSQAVNFIVGTLAANATSVVLESNLGTGANLTQHNVITSGTTINFTITYFAAN